MRRKRWSSLSLLTIFALLAAGSAGAAEPAPAPRPLSPAERAAVDLAVAYLTQGPAGWWDHLSHQAPLRTLGRDEALAELEVRVGPPAGATWRLQTPAGHYGAGAVVFTIEYPSGFDETILLDLVEEDGWTIQQVKCRVDPVTTSLSRLGSLLPLRRALARGRADIEGFFRALPAEGTIALVGRLWEAQHRLEELDDVSAAAVLKRVGKMTSGDPLPLAVLLQARLAWLRYDSLEMARVYREALKYGIDHDGLRLESLEFQGLLGYVDEAGFREAATMGSRLAEVYYVMARTAVYHEDDDALELFRTAWQLAPIERRAFFEDPILANLSLESEAFQLVELGSASEPRVAPPAEGRQPLAFPQTAQMLVSGNALSVILEDGEIEVPGGGVLAPEGTVWKDAGALRRRREETALAELEGLIAASRTPTALANPRLRREMEVAAGALASRRRWRDLERLTAGIAGRMEEAGSVLGRMRATALAKLGRAAEAADLLRRLAERNRAAARREPGVLYQLAELAADQEKYSLAIRWIRQADAMSPVKRFSPRILQLEIDRLMAKLAAKHETPHFQILYPKTYSKSYAEKIGDMLEAERQRLKTWIPLRTAQRQEVLVFPSDAFELVYGRSVIGLFDGKIRIPLDRTPNQELADEDMATLTHELAHALITEYAGEDVPSWFHEGLAQFLEKVPPAGNPIPELHEKKRLLSSPMVDAVLDGYAPQELTEQAYEESAWTLRYINARYGISGIRRVLEAFAAGQDTEPAVQAALKVSMPDFDQALWRWCRSGTASAMVVEPEPKKEPWVPSVGLDFDLEEEIEEYIDEMKAWYRAYSAESRAPKISLRVVVGTLRGHGSASIGPVCRQLEEELTALMAHKQALECPNDEVQFSLKSAYRAFKKMATHCRHGRWSLVNVELGKAEEALKAAAETLEVFGLAP